MYKYIYIYIYIYIYNARSRMHALVRRTHSGRVRKPTVIRSRLRVTWRQSGRPWSRDTHPAGDGDLHPVYDTSLISSPRSRCSHCETNVIICSRRRRRLLYRPPLQVIRSAAVTSIDGSATSETSALMRRHATHVVDWIETQFVESTPSTRQRPRRRRATTSSRDGQQL